MSPTTILIGVLPSVFFGVATTLMGKTGGSDRQRVMGTVLGGLLMAAVATPFLHPQWTPLNLAVSFGTGLLLGLGVCDQLRSYTVLGMSRTMPLSTGGQLVLMSVAGIAVFGEWLHGGALPYGVAAIAVLIVGIWFLSRSEAGSDAAGLDWGRGAVLLTSSTLGLVAFPLIIKYFGIAPKEFLAPQAVGYTAYAAVFFAIQGRGGVDPEASLRHRRMFPSVFNGVLWGIAILLLQLNSNNLGAGTGFTLSQLGILISTPLGILWLHETRSRKELRWTGIGVFLVIAGAVLAGIAKSLDAA
ncbi:sugar transport protein [Schaalia georgiae F0490]|uniref:Sugar transport protein n=1 Tax=Schaalia georgiae F0490 TaxID=1125717 RepID=J0NW06_9ACTO|nr:GRP family sugar transporter [Schaalia georgiae]EJF51624.1 sugar transport protein [Schaalia georgiae F0490]